MAVYAVLGGIIVVLTLSSQFVCGEANSRTLECKVPFAKQCPNTDGTKLSWVAANSTRYKYGFQKLIINATSSGECRHHCVKVIDCSMYEFYPQTEQCTLTRRMERSYKEVVESGRWQCNFKETTYYFPMESILSDRGNPNVKVRTLLGYGINGTVRKNINLVPGLVGNALYITGKGFIDLGTRLTECLGNLEKCKDGLTMSFWLKLKLPFANRRRKWEPLKKQSESTSRVTLLNTKDIHVIVENGQLFARFRSRDFAWQVKVAVKFFSRLVRRYKLDAKAANWFFATLTWHPEGNLTVFLNNRRIDDVQKKFDESGSNEQTTVRIGYVKPAFDSRPPGQVALDELRIWDSRFGRKQVGFLHSTEFRRMWLKRKISVDGPTNMKKNILKKKTKKTVLKSKTKKTNLKTQTKKKVLKTKNKTNGIPKTKTNTKTQKEKEAETKIQHHESIRGVPDNLYHFSMDNVSGNKIDGEGIKGKLVGDCKLSPGMPGKAVMLGSKCYLNLGYKQNECIGNFKLCKKGFTMSMWYRDWSKTGESVFYHFSTGGREPSLILQAAFPKLRLQVLVGGRSWYKEIRYRDMGGISQILKTTWRHLLVTWSRRNGIQFYLDGTAVWSKGSLRKKKMNIKGKLSNSARKNVILGSPPGLKKPKVNKYFFSMFHGRKTHEGALSVDELRFWDKELTKHQVERVFKYESRRAGRTPVKKVTKRKHSHGGSSLLKRMGILG